MKTNKTMRAASFLLVLTLMTSCFVGGTFAKYTSSTTVSDSARVAKWSFEVNDRNIAANETLTVDLFNTVTNVDGGTETGLNTTDGSIIAPGTAGSFAITVENTSEVAAQYSMELTAKTENLGTATLPIEYSVEDDKWESSISNLNVSNKAIAINATETVTVKWRWVIGENTADANDTALGVAAAAATSGSEPKITIEAKVTATQVN